MSHKLRFVLLKNAVANVMRGGAAALVAVLLPPFLTRYMRPDAFGAWCLVLQVSAFVGYLDFGIQTAVGRFVAHAKERGDSQVRDGIVSTAFACLSAAGVIAIAAAVGISILLPHIFRQMPEPLVGSARMALLLVAISLAIGLPASVFNGIFVGLQRNEIPASIIGISRLLSAVGLVLVVRHGGSVLSMGITVATTNLASYLFQYWMYHRLADGTRISRRSVSLDALRELFNYCLSLTIWSFATLLVTGLDITLVGVFDFQKVAYYTVAATLITFILGLQNAIFAALIPAAAVLEARDSTSELGRILVSTTRYGMLLLLASGVPLLVATQPILSIWVGPEYAERASLILKVLVIANIIRLSAIPYAVLLVGVGQQRLVTVSPLVEGFSNLLVSAVAGALIGAVGVALGTLVGSTIGILCNFVYNMPRSTRIEVNRFIYFKDGYLRPVVCAAPVVLIYPLHRLLSGWTEAIIFSASLTVIGTWKLGLSAGEKTWLLAWAGLGSGRASAQTF
jgi:O-antigen/teichoic acid export membrane protein